MQILSEDDLLFAVNNKTFIKDGSIESCEGIKYDFILSNMALTVDSGRPHDVLLSNENAVIKPGEIAFVITKESLDLPGDIYCQLSTKRKLSLDGIVILGGLIIDPNYKGKLIFGLFNLSSRSYPLLPGRKLVAGVFYKTDKQSDKIPEPINDFPDELIKTVVDTKPNSINAIVSTIDNINISISNLRTEIHDIKEQLNRDDLWKIKFQTGLSELQQLVIKIGEKLDVEIDTRRNENSDISKEQVNLKESIIPISKAEKQLQFLKGALVTLIISVVAGIIVYFVSDFPQRSDKKPPVQQEVETKYISPQP